MSLTPRELQVLQLLANGLSRQEIADQLCVHRKTVYNYLGQAREKLYVTSDVQAVILAYRDHLISVPIREKVT